MKVLVSEYNALGNGRYFDVESGSEWSYDHVTQVCALVIVGDVVRKKGHRG